MSIDVLSLGITLTFAAVARFVQFPGDEGDGNKALAIHSGAEPMIRTTLAATGACAIITAALSAQTTPAQPARPTQPSSMGSAQTMTLTGCLKPWDASTMGGGSVPSGATGSGSTGTMGSGSTGSGSTATPGAGSMAGGTAAQQYVLTNAQQGPATAGTGASTPGAPMPPSGSASGAAAMGGHTTYLLKAQSASVNLASHVGHKIEVMGTMAMDAKGSMDSAHSAATGAMGTSGTASTGSGSTATTGSGATATGSTGSGSTGTASHGSMANQHGATGGNSTFTVTSLKMIDKTCS